MLEIEKMKREESEGEIGFFNVVFYNELFIVLKLYFEEFFEMIVFF